ncbi:unnamed protein product [Closterium sp. Yama58-4]|nr:unnamed protein product [Closterium sp. Yama58-4]
MEVYIRSPASAVSKNLVNPSLHRIAHLLTCMAVLSARLSCAATEASWFPKCCNEQEKLHERKEAVAERGGLEALDKDMSPLGRATDKPITMGDVMPKATLREEDVGRPVTKEDAAKQQSAEEKMNLEIRSGGPAATLQSAADKNCRQASLEQDKEKRT